MPHNLRPVLFFDSGIGGLSVLREARLVMPQHHFIYIADDGGFPYGNWKEDNLRERILSLFGWFLGRYDPCLCVIACNTASTIALKELRQHFPNMPFVGTVPAIKPAAEQTFSGIISVLATPGTVERNYTRDLVSSYARQCYVRLVGSCKLAELAENYLRGQEVDYETVRIETAPCFVERQGKYTDIVVMACTHYPFLVNIFRKTAPWPVDWIDPAEAIARQAASLLASTQKQEETLLEDMTSGYNNSFLRQHVDLAYFTSQREDFATKRLLQGFGLVCDW